MSADRLRQAATLMRERAEAATPGPWMTPAEDDEYVGWSDVVTVGKPGHRFVVCEHAGPDAAYIATMSPPVALALADWLDKYADLLDATRHKDRPAFGDQTHALAVADAILGDHS